MKKKEFNFDLKQLRSYLEVLRESSFTAASRKLKIGQATISSHIQALEEMLGVSLIRRTSKEFTVTPQGRAFREFCENIFKDIEQLKTELGRGFSGGITSVSASTVPSAYILPSVIASIKKELPEFFYRVDVSDSREVVEKIKEGKAEIGITGKKFKHSSLVYEQFISDEVVLVGKMDYPDSVDTGELKELPLVARESGSGTRNAYETALKKHNVLPSDLNVVFESYTSDGVKEAAISGVGAAFISNLAITREVRLKVLKIISVKGLKITRKFYAVYQKNRHLSEPALQLLKELKRIQSL
ncbi:MAG: LysR family transcriptional regulator [Spirochaetes bacterium]|nr:LysR family transcriptional regulator [Spirochaetota bacterium]